MRPRVYCQLQFIYLSHPNVSHWMSVNKLDLDATCLCAVVYYQTHVQMQMRHVCKRQRKLDACINMTRR